MCDTSASTIHLAACIALWLKRLDLKSLKFTWNPDAFRADHDFQDWSDEVCVFGIEDSTRNYVNFSNANLDVSSHAGRCEPGLNAIEHHI